MIYIHTFCTGKLRTEFHEQIDNDLIRFDEESDNFNVIPVYDWQANIINLSSCWHIFNAIRGTARWSLISFRFESFDPIFLSSNTGPLACIVTLTSNFGSLSITNAREQYMGQIFVVYEFVLTGKSSSSIWINHGSLSEKLSERFLWKTNLFAAAAISLKKLQIIVQFKKRAVNLELIICNFVKLFRIVIYHKLYNSLKCSVSTFQDGFVEKRSTVTNLTCFTQYMSEYLDLLWEYLHNQIKTCFFTIFYYL